MLHIHPDFYIPQLNRSRTIRVLLPRNYEKNKDRRFPVIYLQDGQNLFDASTAAFRHWKLREFMKKQPLNRQAILVGIDHGGVGRIHEYAPFARGQIQGQGDLYLQFIANTLKPFIDETYRTWGHREATGIVGASMGGLIAFYAGIRYNHVFGKIGALSLSLWFNPTVIKLAEQASNPKSKLYVCSSKTEMRSMSASMEKIYWSLKTGGFPEDEIRVVLRDKGRHSEVFWAREFKGMYEWLFPVTVIG